ncbi:collagen-binding domain-containing protein [Roseateles albus]|uniref:Choice-of-anchor A family protein n=1 Tax=Roseateles albus TaxID=2987525 RepID=A0ABT5KDM7_9BURK|nr:collagen-binding domain-containing protein [Roseateles albus]MDC8772025.1 choice-of-anchor A family protein [Roseateles albus]
MLNRASGLKLVSIAAMALLAGAAQALPVLDLGVASNYSGFFFGNVTKANDFEGRLAVGGDIKGTAFSAGQRVPLVNGQASTAPTVVVGGNVNLQVGTGKNSYFNSATVENGSSDKSWNVNGSIGPAKPGVGAGPAAGSNWNKGTVVYGGTYTGSLNDVDAAHRVKNPSFLDFAAAKTSLQALSSSLSKTGTGDGFALGKVAAAGKGAWTYTLDGGTQKSDFYFFDLGDVAKIKGIDFLNIKEGARIVINNSKKGAIELSGDLGADTQIVSDASNLGHWRGNVLWNFEHADKLDVSTFVNGSILATNADIYKGSGHIEGTLIAKSMSSAVEVGWEPFRNVTAVPEPGTYAMLLAGLGAIGFMARRRKIGA